MSQLTLPFAETDEPSPKRVTIEITISGNKKRTIEAEIFGQLALTPTYYETYKPGGHISSYTISHIQSGYSLVQHISSYEAALELCHEFAVCGIDWDYYATACLTEGDAPANLKAAGKRILQAWGKRHPAVWRIVRQRNM